MVRRGLSDADLEGLLYESDSCDLEGFSNVKDSDEEDNISLVREEADELEVDDQEQLASTVIRENDFISRNGTEWFRILPQPCRTR